MYSLQGKVGVVSQESNQQGQCMAKWQRPLNNEQS